MSVISKSKLKKEFLDGNTITQSTMTDLIDSCYNTGGSTSFWEEGNGSTSALIDTIGNYTVGTNTPFSIIAGGNNNSINEGTYQTIVGGNGNQINISGGNHDFSTIIGGQSCNITLTTPGSRPGNSIMGGLNNSITGDAVFASIVGGSNNNVNARESIVLGGTNNDVNSSGSTAQLCSGILAGSLNVIGATSASTESVIVGGNANEIDGFDRSVVLGGTGIIAAADDTVYVPNLNIGGGFGTPYSLPNTDGNADEVLTTDGVGNVAFRPVTPPTPTILNQVICLTGMFTNPWGNPNEAMEWTSNTETGNIPIISFPYDLELIGATFTYTHQSVPINVPVGDSARFQIGTWPLGTPPISTSLHTNLQNVFDVLVWGNGSGIPGEVNPNAQVYPTTTVTNLSYLIPAGEQVAVRNVETGTVTSTTAEIGVTLWFNIVGAPTGTIV